MLIPAACCNALAGTGVDERPWMVILMSRPAVSIRWDGLVRRIMEDLRTRGCTVFFLA